MLPAFVKNPDIEKFLKHFPKAQWEKCLELTLCVGIQTVYKRFPYGFTIDLLQRTVSQGEVKGSESPGALTTRSQATAPTPEQQREQAKVSPRRRDPTESKRLRIPERSKPEGDKPKSEPRRIPKHLKEVPSRIKAEVRRDIERFHSPEDIPSDDILWETRIKPYRQEHSSPKPSIGAAPRSGNRSKPGSTNSSLLVEPRTNVAYAEKLAAQTPLGHTDYAAENSVLRITDKFLSDPFMATLSSQTSPKDVQLRPRNWGYV